MTEATDGPDRGADELDQAMIDFAAARPRLFGIAYRMLGSVADAEDLLQEVWLRWQLADRSAVRSPAAYLATATTRLAINALGTARARHENYVGSWLPDPVDTGADPFLGAESRQALDLAVLLLMEKLTPTERAAYVLREAFDYPYGQIAEVVGVTETSARQLVSRARRRLATDRTEPASDHDHQRLLEAFVAAARIGDLPALEKLLADDVVSYSDSGGHRVRGIARVPVGGVERVSRFLVAFVPRFWPGITVDYVQSNGRPAARLRRDGELVAILAIKASDDGIEQLLWQFASSKATAFVG